ncbi:MAG TPA: RNA polymerase subunit sigma [Planctomycetaceae bacterium]|nr:RNA polymerase subunit sigma [Planctomycetaceae bacterium]
MFEHTENSDRSSSGVGDAAAMRAGSTETLAKLFSEYRSRLKRIVQFRLDYRLAGRFSESDVLQDAFVAASQRLDHFAKQEMSPFLWLRLVVTQQVVNLYREHVQTEKRDVRKERISLQAPLGSAQTSLAIAANLVGQRTGVSELVARAERIEQLKVTIEKMDPIDREVIALRHFEELSNVETASVLGIETSAASKRYLRAMARLAQSMKEQEAASNYGRPSQPRGVAEPPGE